MATPSKVLAKAMLVAPDGKVLVLQRSLSDVNRPGDVDFPGGGVEDGESFVSAVARETWEEAGLRVLESDLQLVYAFTVYEEELGKIITRLLYVGKVADTDVHLSHEHDAYRWRSLDELSEVFTGKSWKLGIDFVLAHGLLHKD